MLRENRARGDMEWKDVGGSPFLLPDEQPRVQHPFPKESDGCPHCGERFNIVWRPQFFRCYKCSFTREPDTPVIPILGLVLYCSVCGAPTVSRARNQKKGVLCSDECRRKADRERKRKKKNA